MSYANRNETSYKHRKFGRLNYGRGYLRVEKSETQGRNNLQIADIRYWYDKYRTGEMTKTEIAERLGISRPTLNKRFAEYEKRNQSFIKNTYERF